MAVSGGGPKLSYVARKLHEMRDDTEVDRMTLLREFWGVAYWVLAIPERMVSRLLFFERRNPIPRGNDRLAREEDRERRRSVEGILGKEGTKKQRKISEGQKRG